MVKIKKHKFRIEKLDKDRYALFVDDKYVCSGSRAFVKEEKESYKR